MKKLTTALLFAILLAGCSDSTNEASKSETAPSEKKADVAEENVQPDEKEAEPAAETKTETPQTEQASVSEEVSPLAGYSSEEIEYARIWLQLGPNQEIDELNVRKMLAGSPLNPDDETSEVYPEDMIQLAGSRLVDGSVTYSSNKNGTIDVYDIPLRWGPLPAGDDYKNILSQPKLVSIDTGKDEDIIKLIKLIIER